MHGEDYIKKLKSIYCIQIHNSWFCSRNIYFAHSVEIYRCIKVRHCAELQIKQYMTINVLLMINVTSLRTKSVNISVHARDWRSLQSLPTCWLTGALELLHEGSGCGGDAEVACSSGSSSAIASITTGTGTRTSFLVACPPHTVSLMTLRFRSVSFTETAVVATVCLYYSYQKRHFSHVSFVRGEWPH